MERGTAAARPELAEQTSQLILLERAVERGYRPLMLAELHLAPTPKSSRSRPISPAVTAALQSGTGTRGDEGRQGEH